MKSQLLGTHSERKSRMGRVEPAHGKQRQENVSKANLKPGIEDDTAEYFLVGIELLKRLSIQTQFLLFRLEHCSFAVNV